MKIMLFLMSMFDIFTGDDVSVTLMNTVARLCIQWLFIPFEIIEYGNRL
jgi:hypothetical protein